MKLSILTGYVIVGIIFSFLLFHYYPDQDGATLIYLHRKCETCETGERLAEADFEKGTYRLISWGFESQTREMITPILKEDFNITTLFAGCVRFEGVECYHNKMVTLLTEKYGPDIFEKSLAKAGVKKAIAE